MFKHSAHYCTGYTEECVQPNALDITIDEVEQFKPQYEALLPAVVLRKDGVQHATKERLHPVDNILYDLIPGQYSFTSSIFCKIPEGIVGWLVTRSSLNRNGIHIISGVYDSGFNGFVGGTLYVNRRIHIEKGARVAQLITADAEAFHSYNGSYQS